MTRLYFALIGLLGCIGIVSAADLTYESQFCSNISEYVRADDVCNSGDCCPADLSNLRPGPNLDSTSTDVLVDTNKGQDSGGNTTMYVCAWPTSGSAPTEAQVIAGSSPCTDALSKAVSASGEIHFEAAAPAKITGLSASTQYKISAVHEWESRATNELLESAPFTTLAGGGGGGTDLTGTGIFVDSVSGSDSNDGTSDANAWATVAKVNNSVTTVGTDVYFKRGSSYSEETLFVDWGGATDDQAIIGCYYLDAGNSNQPTSCHEGTDPTANGDSDRPTIAGSITQACVDAENCDFTSSPFPSTQSGDLITLQRGYTTIQDINLVGSAGQCLEADGDDDPSGDIVGAIVQRVYCNNVGFSGFIFIDDVVNGIYRDNLVEHVGVCEKQDPDGGAGCSITGSPGAPAGIVYSRNREAAGQRGLIENNEVRHVYGECININRSNRIVIRGNRVGHCDRVQYYANHAQNTLIENNIGYANPANANRWAGSDPFWGIGFAIETCSSGQTYCGSGGDGHVVRNNIIVGAGTGFFVGSDALATGEITEHFGKVYGNTFLANPNAGIDIKTDGNQGVWDVQNNITYNPTDLTASTICNANPGSSFSANLWSSTPSDSDCTGAGDVTGDPDFPISIADAKDADFVDPIISTDVALGVSSDADEAGNNLTATTLTELATAKWSGIFDEITGLDLSNCVDADGWHDEALVEDFNCDTRNAADDIGALND